MSNSDRLVFVLRHGERADRHPSSRHYGVPFDPCLTENGLSQAQLSADKISRSIPVGKSIHLVSSPFLRCIETSSFIAKQYNIPIHLEEGFGEFMYEPDFKSGMPMDRLYYKTKDIDILEEEIGCKIVINSHVIRPQFPESFRQYWQRMRLVWDTYHPRVTEDVMIVVSHLFGVQTLTSFILNQDFDVNEDGYCRLTIAEQKDGVFNVIQAADWSHII